MNKATTPRRWATVAVTLLALFCVTQRAYSQCGDFVTAPLPANQPVSINLFVNTFGMVTLDNTVMNVYGFAIAGGCSYEISQAANFAGAVNLPKVFNCSDIATSPQTWYVRVAGAGGPSVNTRTLIISIFDNSNPTVTCPGAQMRNAAGGVCYYTGAAGEFDPSVSDNCSVVTTNYTLTGATTGSTAGAGIKTLNGVNLNRGVTTVTWTAIDPSGNQASCSFTVTVNDNQIPTVSCPGNQVRNTNTNTCTYTAVGAEFNDVALDNCSIATNTYNLAGATVGSGSNTLNGVAFQKGVTTVTWSATDPSGNAAVPCNFSVTVNDAQAPSLVSMPANVTVGTSTGGATAPPPASNLCDGSVSWNHPTVTDACPGPYTLQMTLSGATSFGPVAVTPGAAITMLFNLGLTTVSYLGTDAMGNNVAGSFQVTVVDNQPPVIFPAPAPFNMSVNVTAGDCSKVITYTRPSYGLVTDCDPGVVMTEFYLSGPDPGVLSGAPAFTPGSSITVQFPTGTTVIRYKWTDAANNMVFIDYSFTVVENEPPVAMCKPSIILTLDAALGVAILNPGDVNNGSTDNCAITSYGLSQTVFTCEDIALFPNPLPVVTLTVSDGNQSSTCQTQVTVLDNTAPVVNCPASYSVSANMGCSATIPSLIFTSDCFTPTALTYCDNSIDGGANCNLESSVLVTNGMTTVYNAPYSVIAGNQINLSSVLFSAGLNTVTVKVKDLYANEGVCSFNVNVVDLTGPTYVSGQANGSTLTVNANIGGCLAQVNWTPPVYTDACSLPVTQVSQSHTPGSFFPFGNTTVTYVFKDAAGNLTTHTFTVQVNDVQAPVANCKNISVALNGVGTVTVTPAQIDNNSTDNCFFTYVSAPVVYNCNNLGANNLTLIIQDGGGLQASCVAVVTVTDPIAPVALCNSVSPIDLDATGNKTLNATTVNNSSTDNTFPACALSYAISVDGGAFNPSFQFTCAWLGNHILTLRVTDAAGNTATCSQTVLVRDVTAPAFTKPANITINCDQDASDLSITGNISGLSDACDPNPSIVSVDAFTAGSCLNSYTISRKWTATDISGNKNTQTQIITVQDVTLPVFNTASTYTIQTDDPGFCDAGPLTIDLPSGEVSDNCSDYGDLKIEYKVDYPTPDYGYVDVPVFTLGSTVLSQFWPIGTTVVTWRVTDECNNSKTFTVSIVVQDTQGPKFDPTIYLDNLGQFYCGKTYTVNNVSNSCSNVFTWRRPNEFASFFGGDIFDDCDFPVTVSEMISNATVQTALNQSNPYPTPAEGNYYFNWFPFAANRINPVAQFPVGTTVIKYTATDPEGNTSVCSFTVKVVDTQAPVFQNCPSNVTFSATCPTAVVQNYTNLQINDNCQGSLTVTQSPAAGTTLGAIFAPNPPAAGNTFQVTITAKDSVDATTPFNTTTCTFTVHLQDGQAPIPDVDPLPYLVDSCGGLIIDAPIAHDPCNPNAPVIYGTPSTPVGMFIPGTPPKYNLMPGNYVITWNYNDGNGNIATQPQNITVLNDIYPPVALCDAPFTINLDNAGNASITVPQIDNGSYDPNDCGPITLGLSQSTFNCDDLGSNTITLTVTDNKGNTATCTNTVTVKDVTPPFLSPAPPALTVQACDPIPPAATLTATDICDDTLNIVYTQISTQDTIGFGKYNYTLTRTWSVVDDSGNSASASQVITVHDTKAPVFSQLAPDTITVYTDPDRLTCDDTVAIDMTPYLTDCATGADLSVSNNFNGQGAHFNTIISKGVYNVVFTASDVSGNVGKDTVLVQVLDGTPPIAACINGVSIALQPSGTVIVTTAQINANSSDNCTPSFQLDLRIQRLDPLSLVGNSILFDCSDADAVTHHPVRLYVKDVAGNESTCETYIIVQDNVDPTITSCPPSKTLQCTDNTSPNLHGIATATDNCPNNVTVTYDDTATSGLGDTCLLVQRTWIATDLAGNTATCAQFFAIQDTVPPTLSSTAPDITISCSEDLPSPANITATDNCSPNVTVQLTEDTINIAQGPCGKYSYTVSRTRTATDDCGNTVTYTRLITVVDTLGPQFLGMPDTITVLSANFPPNANCEVPVALNVGQYLFDCSTLSEITVLNDAPFGNDSLIASGNYPVGQYVIHFEATDACGNVGVDSVVLIVKDNSIPTAICNGNVVISLGSTGEATIDPSDIDLGSVDNCAIDSMYLDQATFDCQDLGLNAVTLNVVDIYGNLNTCTVNVNVTLGVNSGFTLTTQASNVTYFHAADGTASAIVTGGSGSFTYMWSNGAITSTITGLGAGTYTVTVTDTQNGCQATATATVNPGPKLTLIVGNASGAQGAIVQVPVTVQQFNKINSFQFSMNVLNPAVGTIVSISNINPALVPAPAHNALGGSYVVFWPGLPNTTVTLPNGALLFNINVQLGNAPLGSTSPVTIDGVPVPIEFNQDSSGNLILIPADIFAGSVTIDSAGNVVKLAGDVKTWKNPENPNSIEKAIPNATVNLTGTVTNQQITGAPGTYLFNVPNGANTNTAVTKVTVGNAGVTAADLLRIVNHIFGDTFSSPYQWVAADVNNSNTVSLADYLLIQRVALGTDLHFQTTSDWKFIPKAYQFPSNSTLPFGPLSVPFPQNITHNPANMDFLDDDFVGVRMGDVNGNITPTVVNDDPDTRFDDPDKFRFRLEERAVKAGETIEVPFRASDFSGRQAYQLTIAFDPTVFELEEILPGQLPNLNQDNFGTAYLADGHLTTVWVSREPVTLADDATLFTLRFRAVGNANALSDVLQPSSKVTRAEAYKANGDPIKVDFEFVKPNGGQELTPFVLYQNQPNPFNDLTTIGFRLPESTRATLRIYNASGQLVKTVVGSFDKGYNEVGFRRGEFGASGVYYYELETPAQSDRKKMILID